MTRAFFKTLVVVMCSSLAVSCVHAAVVVTSGTVIGQSAFGCARLSQNLSVGMTDARGAIGVSELQGFLVARGYLGSGLATGYFGGLTRAAVIQYQVSRRINATGFVGPLTRSAIQSDSCSGLSNTPSPIVLPDIGKVPHISSISPSSGLVGTQVTVYGTDFDPTNNTIIFGNRAINDVPRTADGTIVFRVPEIAASCLQHSSLGCNAYSQPISRWYDFYVVNSHGRTSNQAVFEFSRPSEGSRPSITDNVAPVRLRINTSATWHLMIKNPGGRSVTAYVTWGDASSSGSSGKSVMVGNEDQLVNFTHAYAREGTYYIQFNFVDDDSGLNTIIDAKVQVSSSLTLDANTVSVHKSLTPAKPGTYVVLNGSGFTPTGNTIYFGKGAIRNLPSYNDGTVIYFTLPTFINPCDTVVFGICNTLPTQVVGDRNYAFAVENSLGVKSPILNFWIKK